MRVDVVWESLPIQPPNAYRATTAIMQSNMLRLCSLPRSNKVTRRALPWEDNHSQPTRVPLAAKSNEPKDNSRSFNYHPKARKPLNEFLNIGRIQDPRGCFENLKPRDKTSLVVRKAPRRVQLPPMASGRPNSEPFPKTGQHYPFLYPVHFTRSDTEDAIGSPPSTAFTKEQQRVESERLTSGVKGEVVYDVYEANGQEGGEEVKHGLETLSAGLGSTSYTALCSGKGTASKFLSKKTRYAKSLAPYYKLKSQEDETLVFESRFESGNLRRAIQM